MTGQLYEIVVSGVIGRTVAAALVGFEVVSTKDGHTRLRGWVVDQAGLRGVLEQMAGFGLELTSVMPAEEAS